MSFSLTDTFEDQFEYEGYLYNLDLSFDNVLLLLEMFDDELLTDYDKILFALEMLIEEYEILEDEDFEVKYELFKYVMKEFIGIDLEEEEKKKTGSGEKKNDQDHEEKRVKFLDYKKDAEIIYASFYAEYGIDLFEMHGKLHWKKFSALLAHLNDKSKLKQVIGYRTAKIPTGKHVDKEMVAHIRKMKRIYSLEEVNSQDTRKALDSAASALKAIAKKKQ